MSLIQAAAVEGQLRGYWESSAAAISFALCNLYILVSGGMSSKNMKQVAPPVNCKMEREIFTKDTFLLVKLAVILPLATRL